MGSALTKTFYMEEWIRDGIARGILSHSGSIVRNVKTGRFVKQLREITKETKTNNPVGIAVVAVALTAVAVIGTYAWVQSRNRVVDPLETALEALRNDLKKGSLELQTAQSLHQQLGEFVTQWQARAADKTATLPKDQVEALERLLKLLTEINQQIPSEALEAGEVQGSIRLLETALAPVPVAVGVA